MDAKVKEYIALILYIISIILFIDRNSQVVAHFWQYLDLKQLETNLLNSLYFLHSQPPLLNLIVGIALKIGSTSKYIDVLLVLHIGMAVANFIIMRNMAQLIGSSNLIVWVCLLSPSVYVYTLWHYEAYYSFTLINLLMLGCLRIDMRSGALLLVGAGAMLSLLHQIFNPFLMMVFFVFVRWYYNDIIKYSRKFFLIAVAVSLILPFAIIAKNHFVFKINSMSSWGGCNFALNFGKNGFGSDGLSTDGDEPVLYTINKSVGGRINLNNIGVINKCKALGEQSIVIAKNDPAGYFAKIYQSITKTIHTHAYQYPASRWSAIGKFYFEIVEDILIKPFESLMPLFIIIIPATPILLRRTVSEAKKIVPISALYYIHLIIIHAFNRGEQQRMNFKFYFFMLVCLFLVARYAIVPVQRSNSISK